jgi:hypothetical protein
MLLLLRLRGTTRLRLLIARLCKSARQPQVRSGLIPHSALVGVRELYGKAKTTCSLSKVVIAISHPDQWGFWEWLGQTPRLV